MRADSKGWLKYEECPTCGAEAGKPCLNRTEQKARAYKDGWHKPRTISLPHHGRWFEGKAPLVSPNDEDVLDDYEW